MHSYGYPVKSDAHLEDMKPSNLTPAFKRDVNIIRDAVCNTKPKKIRNQDVCGPVLLAMADALCSVLSKGGTPQFAPMWKTTALAANAEMRLQIVDTFTKKLQAQFTPDPKLTFWSLQELHTQMLCALEAWTSKQSFSQPEEAARIVDACWQIIMQASTEKQERWKALLTTAAAEDDDSDEVQDEHAIMHLIPEPIRKIIFPLLAHRTAFRLETQQLKKELASANSARLKAEEEKQDAEEAREEAQTNRVDGRTAQHKYAAKQLELDDALANLDVLQEVALQKSKKLKQSIDEQKEEIKAVLAREAVLEQKLSKAIAEKNEGVQREKLLQSEKSQASDVAETESKKRKYVEKSTEKLNKNITVLQNREQELEIALQQSAAAEQKLRMENTRLRMLVTAQQM